MVNKKEIEIHLAHTQGFCAGVESAIEVVNLALAKYGAPLYVRHAIVHNTTVIADFERQGVIFIESLDDVPEKQVVIFSAHGTAPDQFERAKERQLKIIDATCPLVTKVHRQAVKLSEREIHTVLIGHRGHQELLGTSGYVDPNLLHIIETEDDIDDLNIPDGAKISYLTQTTLSIDETQGMITKLRKTYPQLMGPPKANICYATQNRQDAVKELADDCDVVIICGSPNSSNSNRLRETAADQGITSYIIDTVDEFQFNWIKGKDKIGISSGASVPRKIVDELVDMIVKHYPNASLHEGKNKEEGILFPIPNI